MTYRIRDLAFRYPGAPPASTPTLDLAGLDLEVGGGTLVLLGESGSGKTTLLNLLGLLWDRPPASGEIIRCDAGADAGGPRGRARLRREEYGFVLQSSFLLPHFSVESNVAVPLELTGLDAPTIRRRVASLLSAAGLSALARRKARDLSGGQKQRVAVLRALVHDPRVVFADEPVSSLDRQNAGLVLNLLARWREGSLAEQRGGRGWRTLVLVSHNLRQSREVAGPEGMALILFEGRVVGGRAYRLASISDDAVYEAIERGQAPEAIS